MIIDRVQRDAGALPPHPQKSWFWLPKASLSKILISLKGFYWLSLQLFLMPKISCSLVQWSLIEFSVTRGRCPRTPVKNNCFTLVTQGFPTKKTKCPSMVLHVFHMHCSIWIPKVLPNKKISLVQWSLIESSVTQGRCPCTFKKLIVLCWLPKVSIQKHLNSFQSFSMFFIWIFLYDSVRFYWNSDPLVFHRYFLETKICLWFLLFFADFGFAWVSC